MGDLKNNELDMQNLAVVVKMKVNGDGIEKLIGRLQKARETKKKLLRYVQMIARGEYIDVEKEFI